MSTKSDTWKHFVKKGSSGVGKYCHIEVKTCGNTTNLRNHLLRRHPCIKSVSQRPQPVVVEKDVIGIGKGVSGGKKQTGVCTSFFFLHTTRYICLFFINACLFITCVFLKYSFYCIYFLI